MRVKLFDRVWGVFRHFICQFEDEDENEDD